MKRRIIKTGNSAREELAKGAKVLHDAVVSSLGPFGQTFFLDKKDTITNDGVSIAKEIQLQDEVQNRGAKALREAAIKTVEKAGDGTTTAIALAYPIYEEASKLLGSDATWGGGKKSPASIRAQVDAEKNYVIKKLQEISIPIETEDDLIASARVSTGSDELADLIGKAQFSVGKEGILVAEITNEPVCSVEEVQGIRFDNGLTTGRIVNNHERDCFEINNVRVILTGQTIREPENQVAPILEKLSKIDRTPVILIARAFTEEAMAGFAENLQKGGLPVYPLNAPYTDMAEVMKDLAAYTGASYYDSEGTPLKDMNVTDVGIARRVEVFRWHTLVIGVKDANTREKIEKRIEEIDNRIKGSTSDFNTKLLQQRKAQMLAGFRIVKVGNPSDMERQRLFDKADDAVNAVRAAYQEGVVAGAGVALKEIAETMPENALLRPALMAPYQQIQKTAPEGFVIAPWVRDPVKVLRIALEQAVEASMSFASAGGVITEEFPKKLDELLIKQ